MRKYLLVTFSAIFVFSCANTSSHEMKGAAAGGAVGGVAGALIDSGNPWRGGVIGAALGAVAGATLTDIAVKGAKESSETGKPVEYRRDDNYKTTYRAEPASLQYATTGNAKCRKVREKIYQNDVLIKTSIKEICETERYIDEY